ncbi:MAG: PD-(D/E)XK nuclease family protein [Ruminiclostridium sp.]|nr:PD-(D/E)XK nuclease family protein [Ruminiclostridium sp.]
MRKLITAAASAGRDAVLFVPDQFSFEAEKLIYRNVPHTLLRRCRVAMFAREAQRILRLRGETKEYADDIAKHIAMKRALEECASAGSLHYYRGQAAKQGFPSFALGMVSDMRGAGISPSELRGRLAADESVSEALFEKLSDISEIYSAYDRILSANFDDKLDDVRRAAESVLSSDIYDGCEVFFDEFESFSGSQLGFIRALLDKAERVTVALTCDYPECKERKFDAVNRLAAKLAGDGEKDVTRLTERYRSFKELHITEARDMWQECDWICAEIRSLFDKGVRCRDIAVLTPDSAYNPMLYSAMKKYGIPVFADIPEPLITRSFVRFAIYTLKALTFETGDVLRYIKSGFVRNSSGKVISNIQIDRIEQLARAYDLRKRDWLRKFPEKLDPTGHLEELRRSIIEPLKELQKAAEGADGAELTRLLCSHICGRMDIYKTIYGKCIIGHKEENDELIVDRRKLEEYSEIWDDTVTVFESAHKALKGCYLPLDEYIGILTDVFTSTTVAKPPSTLDAVTVGDTERSRFTDVRYVFICGFAQGIMPPPPRMSEIFTPSESEQLTALGIPVTTDRLSRFSQELFTVYRCTGVPSEKLYITYPLLSEDGRYLEPAAALTPLRERCGAHIDGADNYGAEFYCRTEKAAERYLARFYRDSAHSGERKALIRKVKPRFTEMLRSAARELPDRDRHRIDGKCAKTLLTPPRWSPTAITLVNRCKFAFFCKYGLGLREDGERAVDAALVGTVIHFCLQRLLADYTDDREAFAALTDAQISEHVAESIRIYEETGYFGDFGGAERFSYLLRRLGRYAVRAALRIRDECASGGFYPEALEKRLTFGLGGITVSGICDRIDTMQADGTKYVRVVDYKRSRRTFELEDIFKGEDLQMLLYLFGVCSLDPSLHPSSVMYLPVGKLSYENSDGGDIEAKARKSLQNYMREHSPAGLILSDSPEKAELDALNETLTERYGKLRGSYTNHTEVTPEVFAALRSYCASYIGTKAAEAASGMSSACPRDPAVCEYCEFSLFCGRE